MKILFTIQVDMVPPCRSRSTSLYTIAQLPMSPGVVHGLVPTRHFHIEYQGGQSFDLISGMTGRDLRLYSVL